LAFAKYWSIRKKYCFSSDNKFLSLVALAFVISIPIAWYAMHEWLQDLLTELNYNGGCLPVRTFGNTDCQCGHRLPVDQGVNCKSGG